MTAPRMSQGAYPHQIMGSSLEEGMWSTLEHQASRFRFSHTETTDGIPLKTHLDQRLSASSLKSRYMPLNDREERRTFLLPHL
jgi:hypothetical protein